MYFFTYEKHTYLFTLKLKQREHMYVYFTEISKSTHTNINVLLDLLF